LIHDLISRDQRFAGIGLPGVTSEGDIQASGNDNLLEIHTIDGFQGREKDIIIISTVRTGSGRNIGFLDDHRRLNVALTRARKQLILVCSVRTLSRNQNWRQFIDQARTFPDIVFASASRYPSGQY
jgi:superfamily I DNA and/or RNA helicase